MLIPNEELLLCFRGRRLMIKNFRDVLAICIGVVVFPALWIIHGYGIVEIPEAVIGATIAIETLIGQFYYRKATTENG